MLSDRPGHSIVQTAAAGLFPRRTGAAGLSCAIVRLVRKNARKLAATVAIVVFAAAMTWLLWPRAIAVDTIVVKRAPAMRTLAVNGTVRPRLSVEVQSPVAGTLTALPLDVGDRVAKGALLARVDDAPQRAAIGEAQASVAAQEAVLAQARRDLARFVALGEFVTRQRKEEARLAVEQGQQELRRRRAALVQAREVQQRFEVRAPFAGVIMERPVDPGQTILATTVLYRLADLSAPQVAAEVDETYAVTLASGGEALVSVPGRAAPVPARIAFVEPRVDRATGAREVRLSVAEPLGEVPAGLTLSVNLIVAREAAAISIPRSAILQPDSNPRVRVVGAGGEVAERPIRFIDWPAQAVTVTQGLAPGTRILADPEAAAPGTRVRLRD